MCSALEVVLESNLSSFHCRKTSPGDYAFYVGLKVYICSLFPYAVVVLPLTETDGT
jgi:hypothetical protein